MHCMEYEKRCFYHGRWLTLKTLGQEITTVQEAKNMLLVFLGITQNTAIVRFT